MEHPVSGLDAFLEWQERLKCFESSGLSIDAFCRQEDVDRSQFAKWPSAVRSLRPDSNIHPTPLGMQQVHEANISRVRRIDDHQE